MDSKLDDTFFWLLYIIASIVTSFIHFKESVHGNYIRIKYWPLPCFVYLLSKLLQECKLLPLFLLSWLSLDSWYIDNTNLVSSRNNTVTWCKLDDPDTLPCYLKIRQKDVNGKGMGLLKVLEIRVGLGGWK